MESDPPDEPPHLYLIQGGRSGEEPPTGEAQEELPDDSLERMEELLRSGERLLAEAEKLLGKPPEPPA